MGYTQDGSPKNIQIWEFGKLGSTALGEVIITVSKDFKANQLVFPFTEYQKKKHPKKKFTVVSDYMKEKQDEDKIIAQLEMLTQNTRETCALIHLIHNDDGQLSTVSEEDVTGDKMVNMLVEKQSSDKSISNLKEPEGENKVSTQSYQLGILNVERQPNYK